MDHEIHSLLTKLERDEDAKAAAYDLMLDYRAFSLARPNEDHVGLLKALLKTKLRELLASARRDGRL